MMDDPSFDSLKQELINETAKIPWRDLQRFFAAGKVIQVSPQLDLIDVAVCVSRDDTEQVSDWMADERISAVSDSQALNWYESETVLWAVVVKPWVLVQDKVIHDA